MSPAAVNPRKVSRSVTGGHFSDGGDVQVSQLVFNDAVDFDAELAGGAIGKASDGDPPDPIELSGTSETGKHSIDSVARLRDVFNDEDGPLGEGKLASGCLTKENCEVSPHEGAGSDSLSESSEPGDGGGLMTGEESEERVAIARVDLAQARAVGAMDGAKAFPVESMVNDRGVGKSADPFGSLVESRPIEIIDETPQPVASPRDDNGPGRRVIESLLELRSSLFIASG